MLDIADLKTVPLIWDDYCIPPIDSRTCYKVNYTNVFLHREKAGIYAASIIVKDRPVYYTEEVAWIKDRVSLVQTKAPAHCVYSDLEVFLKLAGETGRQAVLSSDFRRLCMAVSTTYGAQVASGNTGLDYHGSNSKRYFMQGAALYLWVTPETGRLEHEILDSLGVPAVLL